MAKPKPANAEVQTPLVGNKVCFVIAPIGADGSETRRRSDKVLRHIIKPAAEALGLAVIRADQIDEPGMITNQIVQQLITAEIVVADLTENNPNVFYELAIRHVLRKPFIHLVEVNQKIPFDVAGNRAIVIDHRDLDSAAKAKEDLGAQIKAALQPGAIVQSPFSVAVDLESLRGSEDPEKRGLADVVEILSRLTASVSALERKVEENSQDVRQKTGIPEEEPLKAVRSKVRYSRYCQNCGAKITWTQGNGPAQCPRCGWQWEEID